MKNKKIIIGILISVFVFASVNTTYAKYNWKDFFSFGQIKSIKKAANTSVMDNLKSDSDWKNVIAGKNIKNGTISGDDLADDIDIETTGDVSASSYKIGDNVVLKTDNLNNTFVGDYAGIFIDTGESNSFFGSYAGAHNTSGIFNTFVGNDAGRNNTDGQGNVFLGSSAGTFSSSASLNVFVGSSSGEANVDGDNNTFIGDSSGFNNVSGYSNTFLGSRAGLSNVTGSGNVFIGNQAGLNETGNNKLYITNSDTDSDHSLIYGDFENNTLSLGGGDATVSIGDDSMLDTLHIVGITDIAAHNWGVTDEGLGSFHGGLEVGCIGVSCGADFSGASSMTIPRGDSAPDSGDCSEASEIGRMYINTVSGGNMYVCTNKQGTVGWDTVNLTD